MAKGKVITALDVATRGEALEIVEELGGNCAGYKIGKRLFTACGSQLVDDVARLGGLVFLDLKYHDIPNTVAEASVEATNLGVAMFNMHAMGGLRMMQMAKDEVIAHVNKQGNGKLYPPLMLGVTVLTSHDYESLVDVGFFQGAYDHGHPVELEKQKKIRMKGLVLRLAQLAQKAGLDGVVTSPQEAAMIRAECGKDFKIVTPGIRPAGADADDQVRIATPAGAIKNGADLLVIGRPIIGKPVGERLAALELINKEVQTALAE